MSNIGNKKTMSDNLKYYIEKSGKDRRELAEIWGFPYSTVTEWINGRKYPRIDRIETMANYFGILKSDLIEERTPEREAIQKKSSTIADAVLKMKSEDEFLTVVEMLLKMDSEQIRNTKEFLSMFLK